MGSSYAVLIILFLLMPSLPASADPYNSCLKCHPAHYVTLGACTACHLGDLRTARKKLAHSGLIEGRYASFTNRSSVKTVAGRQLTEKTACRRCHVLNATGNRLAANLDSLLWIRKPETVRSALLTPALYMPKFYFSESDIDLLVTAIFAGGAQAGKAKKEPPQVVHFNPVDSVKQNIFVKNCGSCHKLLSKQDGGLGVGIIGPNLSGLLSRFYPHTFKDNKTWNEENLKLWLKNPRAVRKNTTMRPFVLKPEEWEQLLKTIQYEKQIVTGES